MRAPHTRSIIAIATAAGLLGLGGTAIANAASTPAPKVQSCVKYGPAGGKDATGNYILNNWNNSKCPSGTYAKSWDSTGAAGATGPAGPSGVVAAKTVDLGGVASVPTGGSFVTNSTEVGDGVQLNAGTYEVSVTAKATPPAGGTGAVQVFPTFALYTQAKNAAFTGNVLNVGSGALESGANATIDSNFSGSTLITLGAATTLHEYAFGYDSDTGAGTYVLDDLQITFVQVTPAAG